MTEVYDAFISYSHAADGALAPAVQKGLSRLAKPWYRREALRVFRDDTGLAVTPELWASIATALESCSHFVLLASPEAAASSWVNREIEHWKTHKSVGSLLPVVTAGEWIWDDSTGDLDLSRSTAVPPALVGAFREEPRHLDLRWARSQEQLDLRNGRFRNAVAELAAPISGVAKEELESEDLRLHKRALRLARGAIVGLVVLTVGALIAGGLAVVNANRAEDRRVEATSRQLAAQALAVESDSPVEALMLGAAAHEVQPTSDTFGSLLQLVQARPRLERFLDTTPGGANTSVVVSDNGRRVAFIRTKGAATTAIVAPLGPRAAGATLRRRVRHLEGIWFVDNQHVALVAEHLAVMGPDGQIDDVAARKVGSLWTVSPDKTHALVASADGHTVIVDLDRRTARAVRQPPSPGFVAFSADSARVLIPTGAGWQLFPTSGHGAPAPVLFPSSVGNVTPRFLPDGSLLGAGQHGLAVVPTADAGVQPIVVPLDAFDGQYWFDVSTDGRLAIVRTQTRLFLVDLETSRVRWERPTTSTGSFFGTMSVGFSGSGEKVFDVGPEGLTISAAATGEIVRRYGGITAQQVGPRARRSVADSPDTLDVVNLETGLIQAERRGIGPANIAAWSPNGRYLLTAGVDTVLWDLAHSPVRTEPLTVSASFTRGAVLSAKYAVTAGSENVALWHLGAVVPYGKVAWAGRGDAIETLDPDGSGGVRASGDEAGYEITDLSGARRANVRIPGATIVGATDLWGSTRALVEYSSPTGHGLDLVDLEHDRVVRRGNVCGGTTTDEITPSVDGSHLLATIDTDPTRAGAEQLRSCRSSDGRQTSIMTPTQSVTGVAGPNRDGTLAAFPSQGVVHIVDLQHQREVERFAMPGPAKWEGLPGRAVFASDDHRVVAEWYFGAVVHDRRTGRTRSVRRSHVNTTWLPQRIDVDPTGKVAAVSAAVVSGTNGGLASELSLVDLDSMQVLGPVQLPSLQLVTSARASSSGRNVDVTGAAGSSAGAHGVRLRFSLADRHLARLACQLLAHTPTRAEWEQRLPTTAYIEVCHQGQ